MKQVDLTWEWFDHSARAMAQRCRARLGEEPGAIDGIIALGRGGMPLSTRLSHLLGAHLCGAVLMSRFKSPLDRPTPTGIPPPPLDGVVLAPHVLEGRGPLLLVDNIISEGVTLQLALRALEAAGVGRERLVVCSLLARGRHAPDGIIGARVDPESWYIFPWEAR